MAPVTLYTALTIPDSVVFRELDGEAVLLDVQSGQYFGLNAVGTRSWQLLVELGRPKPVLDALLEEFDAPPAKVEADLLQLVNELTAHGLVTAAP